MDKYKIGNFLLTLRTEKNLTQQDVADMFHLTPQAISKWEAGQSIPDVETLTQLSNFYGVTINEILNGERGTGSKNQNDEDDTPLVKRLKSRVAPFAASCSLMALTLIFLALDYFTIKGSSGYVDVYVTRNGYELLNGAVNGGLLVFFYVSLGLNILIFGMGFGVFFSEKGALGFRLVQHIAMWLLPLLHVYVLPVSGLYLLPRIGWFLSLALYLTYIILFYTLSQNRRKNLKRTMSR